MTFRKLKNIMKILVKTLICQVLKLAKSFLNDTKRENRTEQNKKEQNATRHCQVNDKRSWNDEILTWNRWCLEELMTKKVFFFRHVLMHSSMKEFFLKHILFYALRILIKRVFKHDKSIAKKWSYLMNNIIPYELTMF